VHARRTNPVHLYLQHRMLGGYALVASAYVGPVRDLDRVTGAASNEAREQEQRGQERGLVGSA
jgi:hypothetical protein